MAPSILHRALSFSNVPVHCGDVSPLKEASAASNRHEGLALLTTIAEDTGSCNPSPLLPNHLALEKRLISKILVLREALDLPCRSSCDALDQVHAKNSHLSHLKTMTAGLYNLFFPLNTVTSGYPGGSEDYISEMFIRPIRKQYIF